MLESLQTRIHLALAAMNAAAPLDTPELDLLFQRLHASDKESGAGRPSAFGRSGARTGRRMPYAPCAAR